MAEESIARLFPGAPRALDPATVDAEADEGLLLAEYATRMRLKNRILVDTMAAGGEADEDAWLDEVRLSLGRLRLEAEQSARRMTAERDAAAATGGLAVHEHDYRHRDAGNLERRRLVAVALSRRLIRWENDDARVRDLLAAAREDAAAEMRSAVAATVVRDAAAAEEDGTALDERLRLLHEVDLPALATIRTEQLERAASAAPRDLARSATGRRLLGRLRRRRR